MKKENTEQRFISPSARTEILMRDLRGWYEPGSRFTLIVTAANGKVDHGHLFTDDDPVKAAEVLNHFGPLCPLWSGTKPAAKAKKGRE